MGKITASAMEAPRSAEAPAVGNLVAETTSLTRTYTYDADNELTMEQTSPTIYILYDYDRNGNRIDALPWDGGGEHF